MCVYYGRIRVHSVNASLVTAVVNGVHGEGAQVVLAELVG